MVLKFSNVRMPLTIMVYNVLRLLIFTVLKIKILRYLTYVLIYSNNNLSHVNILYFANLFI